MRASFFGEGEIETFIRICLLYGHLGYGRDGVSARPLPDGLTVSRMIIFGCCLLPDGLTVSGTTVAYCLIIFGCCTASVPSIVCGLASLRSSVINVDDVNPFVY